MGYQEMTVEVRPNKDIREVLRSSGIIEMINKNNMQSFITLIGTYNKNNHIRHLVFATDRHPGADFLLSVYKRRCNIMDDVYDAFEAEFKYIPLDHEIVPF